MQRFKKEFHSIRQGEPVVCHFRNCPCNRAKGGKFVYGANGTLTQAARWRIQAIKRAGNIACVCYNSKDQRAHLIRLQVSCIRSLLQSAREGGCYLP
jgi:hypothetical protein